MKYIKLYENIKTDFFKSMINYDVIADLKELCMEDIDDNYTLVIIIYSGGRIANGTVYNVQYMGEITINHAGEKESFSVNTYSTEELKRKIHYSFYLRKSVFLRQMVYKKDIGDILNSIKSMYPDIIIVSTLQNN